MRGKLHSQRETVISLPKLWDSPRNRETWQVCCCFKRRCRKLIFIKTKKES